MIRSYIITAIRNAIRNKAFSLINIFGLSIGIACSIYITYWVRDELSFDKFHDKSEQIFRVYWQDDNAQTRTPHPMAQALVADFPEIENAVSLSPIWGPGLTIPIIPVKYEDKRFEESGFYSADTTFFKIFSFKLLKGNPATALKESGGVIISEKMALKYFGNEDPLDKMITITYGKEINLKVTGVIENISHNSHFKFDFLISYLTLKSSDSGEYYTWADFGHFNYILLKNKEDAIRIEKLLNEWSKKYIDWPEKYRLALESGIIGFKLQAITDIHLHSNLKWELEQNGNYSYIWIFSTLALLIIVIACINFMNLSTAKSSKRAKEIGIRKVSGAKKRQVLGQFMGESFLTVLLSLFIAIILFEIFRPAFNNLTLKQITINYSDLRFIIDIIILLITITVFAGIYPAFFMARFKPNDVLKGNTKSGVSGITFRRIMVIIQFSISTALIIGTLIVSQQINFLNNEKLGVDSNQIIVVPIKDNGFLPHIESLEEELLKNKNIYGVSAISNIPGRQFNQNPIRWSHAEEYEPVSELHIDYNFFKLLNLRMLDGREFSKDFITDSLDVFILNETASKLFDWKSAVNEIIIWDDDEIQRKGKVIGIVEDFHFQSLRRNIEPLIIKVSPSEYNYLLIKINTDKTSLVNADIKSKLEEMNYNGDYSSFFLNDDISNLYSTENQMRKMFFYFTLFAIFISCLGLFGLTLFMTEQRTKEIGIRRVHGSSIVDIMIILSKEFLKWVLLAILIAIPVSYFIMQNWLQSFAFKIDLKWWVFGIASILSFLIAILTISYQTYKTAIKNPVDSLRYE
ncbi:MAG: FtsX-like permease family protein [Bacteroidales bacterium]|nr:FtsX-like permease family protein [Bacteroidales bacterium]